MSGPPRVLRVQSIPPPSARTLDHPVQGGFKWLRRNEGTGVFTSPLAGHPLLDPKMRSILIDWMMEVCQDFRFCRETFNLAVAVCDSFLMKTTGVLPSKLQLVGVASMYISAKMEEVNAMPALEFARATAGATDGLEVKEMEAFILATLDFNLNPVTTYSWLSALVHALGASASAFAADKPAAVCASVPRQKLKRRLSDEPFSAMVPNEQHAFEPRLPCCGGGQAAAALAPASTSPLRLSVTEPVAHTLSSVTANFLPALDLLPLYSAVPAYGGAPSLALPTGLRMLAPFLGCSECQDAIKSETGLSELSVDIEKGCMATYPSPRSPVDLLLAAAFISDACSLTMAPLRFKPRVLASAILKFVGGAAYGPVLDQLIHTFVLVDDDGAFGGVDTLRSELLSCSEWLQQVGCALPRFRLHPGLSDVLTEVSPLDFACLQSHYPDLLRFAKVVTEWEAMPTVVSSQFATPQPREKLSTTHPDSHSRA